MLQTVLCQEATVNPLIQEAKYLRHLVGAYQFGKQHFKTETRDYFRDFEAYLNFNRRIVRAFMKQLSSQFPEARHLVLREPHLTMLFPELAQLLTGARFVCVVRDPRDTIASMIEVGKKLKDGQISQDAMARLFTSGDMKAISRHYLSFYQPVLRLTQPEFQRRVLMIRYEDLVTEPVASIRTLRKFTGIPLENFDPDRDPDTGKIDYRQLDTYRKAWASESYSRKITGSRMGRYADVLSREEVETINSTCAEFMKRFNYA